MLLRGGALGDFVLALPVLSALRETWPEAEITLVAGGANTRLALFAGLADRALPFESAVAAVLYAHDPPPDALARLGRYDLAVALVSDPEGMVHANLARLGVTTLVSRDPRTVSGHACDYFAGVLRPIGLRVSDAVAPHLDIPSAQTQAAGSQLVIMHPGSGSPAKNWPAASFRELADRLTAARSDVQIAFSFGEADDALASAPAFRGPYRHLTGSDLPELARALAGADAYVGNDSGVTHLAAATGIPVTAIFGPTDERVWGPRGSKVRILRPSGRRSAGIGNVPVAAVLASVLEVLPSQ